MAVVRIAVDALLEPRDPALDRVRLVGAQAVAGGVAQLTLDLARLVAKALGLAVANDVAPVELVDMPLQLVDADLQVADMAVIVVAIAVDRTARRRIILR